MQVLLKLRLKRKKENTKNDQCQISKIYLDKGRVNQNFNQHFKKKSNVIAKLKKIQFYLFKKLMTQQVLDLYVRDLKDSQNVKLHELHRLPRAM